MLKKKSVGKRESREAAKNNTDRPNETQNVQFIQQRRLLKRKVLRPKIWDEKQQLRSDKQDVVGDKCVTDDSGNFY